MRTILLCLTTSFLFYAHTSLYGQCEIKITGKNCKDSVLTANVKGGTLTALEWKLDGKIIPTDGLLRNGKTVAGGNGEGDSSNQLDDPNGVFVDGKGNLWVADTHNQRIQEFIAGSEMGITIGANLPNAPVTPTNLFVSDDGAVYVADYVASRIKKLARNAKKWIDVAGQNNEMKLTRGVWVDKNNNVYATDEGNSRVLKYSPDFTAPVVVAGGNGYGRALNQLAKPVSVVLDNANNIYVTEEKNQRVTKWFPGAVQGIIVAGNFATSDSLLPAGKGGVHDPIYGFVTTEDNLGKPGNKSVKIYISDIQQNEIQLWYEGDTTGVVIAGGHGKGDNANQLNKPFGNYVFGNFLYVADRDNARIQRFNLVINPTTPRFVADKAGSYSVTANFSNGCKAESNTIQVSNCNRPPVASPASILNISKKITSEGSVFVYPNPAVNSATVSFSAVKAGKYVFTLTETNGRILLNKEVNAQAGANSISIDLSHFAKGMYFITITGSNETQQIHLNKE